MIKGKNAIITGARSGIGLATVEKFASNGANVWAVVHREDDEFLSKIKKLSEQYEVWIRPVYIDLANENEISRGIKEIISEKLPIDILVNAAGVVSPRRLFIMTSMSDMRKLMDVNFFAAMQISQLVSRVMMKQRQGNIINVSSVSAWGDDSSQIEYASSKAAIICATKKIASELGIYGIRVNAVAPGVIDTKMLKASDEKSIEELKNRTDIKRFGKPEEVADLITYLASNQSSYVIGQTIRIDGGM